MLFLVKKIVGFCLMPLTVSLLLLVAGAVLLWLKRWQRLARWLVTGGLAVLILAAYGFPGRLVVRRLEAFHPPFTDATPVTRVVVLGGTYSYSWYVPERNHAGTSSIARVVEGVRIYRLQQQPCTLVLSGIGVSQGMRTVALDLGIPPESIVIDNKSADTKDQARLLRDMLGTEPFALVTSASHMPRAMAMFRKQGMNPIPAPTHYLCVPGKHWSASYLFPSAARIEATERAEYEVLGLIWAKLRGQI